MSDLTRYIGRTSPLYADRMVDRILRRIELLADFPDLGHIVPEAHDEQIREVIVDPYRIIYLSQRARIDILAVVHGRRLLEWPP